MEIRINVVVSDGRNVLLLKRFGRVVWDIPSSRFSPEELTHEKAAVNILFLETGLRVKEKDLEELCSWTDDTTDIDNIVYLYKIPTSRVFIPKCHKFFSLIRTRRSERVPAIEQYDFFPIEKISEFKFSSNLRMDSIIRYVKEEFLGKEVFI